MKSSTLKRVAICVLLLIIGGIGGYLLANHQFHKRAIEERFSLRPPHMDSMFYNPMEELRHRERDMENMRDDIEKRQEEIRDSRSDLENFEDLKDVKGDTNSNGSFHYYQKTNNNGEESSYNVNGKWNDGENGGTITMSGTNVEGKDFSYSGTMHNGKSEGILVDEDGNTKDMNLQELDLEEIYDDSNSLSE